MIGAFPTALKRTTTTHTYMNVRLAGQGVEQQRARGDIPLDESFCLYVSSAASASLAISGCIHVVRVWPGVSGLPGAVKAMPETCEGLASKCEYLVEVVSVLAGANRRQTPH